MWSEIEMRFKKDITPIRRLPLSLDFHREGKGGVGVSDA